MSDAALPEYRRDPVSGRWVVIAPERSARPMTLAHAEPHHRDADGRAECPFCEGMEHDTPHETYALRAPDTVPDGPGWRLRVVPNKFPAVRPIAEVVAKSRDTFFEARPGFGRHEVVIECARHVSDPVALSDDEFRDVLLAYRDRVAALSSDPRCEYVTVFKNVGAEAGASLAHLHSQIVATPMVPDAVVAELAGANAYYTREGRCVFCDIIARDLADGRRVVAESTHFIALAPFAPRFAYETWVLPKEHDSRYETLTDIRAGELAGLMRRVLAGLDRVLRSPAYNYYLHTGPARSAALPHYHWHIEIAPRTARAAGFEWGSGWFINAVPPERAAEELRELM
ncbi:galactose-1-phosphate uridylyltransferase [Fimbriiglobus ruber]|uniref:Galactose-1-phosphate uridylyltransferase n=1 Tax=Fimbriiglobus ruber TaxID=1908690 RepID=A0A225E0G9_9BACT|nr:galactose-1-phosphate uridylyltransferase [Fimbriiglobus ruber]OWK44298.1 Galactose-1-phosphate uridylyltransferase [Fimbriiglobus ruber]